MSYEPKKEEIQQEEDPNHRIRITISSKNCKAIERISNEIVRSGKDKGLKVKVRTHSDWPDFNIQFSRAQSDSPPRLFESPPERRPMVKVPRPGIASRCESTSE
jgi:hypothetical protein